jgi:hypothetical protein
LIPTHESYEYILTLLYCIQIVVGSYCWVWTFMVFLSLVRCKYFTSLKSRRREKGEILEILCLC